jgi:hypothetical protein
VTYKGLTVFTILAGLATTSSAQGMGDDVTLRVLVKSDVAVEYEAGRLQKADLSIEPEFGADLGWAGRLQFRGCPCTLRHAGIATDAPTIRRRAG